MNLQLSAALTDNVRTRPLIDGAIRPQSVDLYTSVLYPTEIFWRQLHHAVRGEQGRRIHIDGVGSAAGAVCPGLAEYFHGLVRRS